MESRTKDTADAVRAPDGADIFLMELGYIVSSRLWCKV